VRKNRALYDNLLKGKLDHLSSQEKALIEPVLLRYAHLFHDEDTKNFKGTDVLEHHIITNDALPIRRPPCRIPYSQREEMESQVQKMLDKIVIRESNLPWSAPAILVPKKSPDSSKRLRFGIDFVSINSVTKCDTYPLPVFEETTSTLCGAKYFAILDCYSGFWQISICESSVWQI
jgi:hypothetical protein